MVDAYPNVQLIEAIAYGKDAYDVSNEPLVTVNTCTG